MSETVVVAVITAIPATIAATAAARSAWKTNKQIQGNGKGTLVSMVEDILDWQIDHDRKHDRLVRRVQHAESDLDDIADTGRIPTFPHSQQTEKHS